MQVAKNSITNYELRIMDCHFFSTVFEAFYYEHISYHRQQYLPNRKQKITRGGTLTREAPSQQIRGWAELERQEEGRWTGSHTNTFLSVNLHQDPKLMNICYATFNSLPDLSPYKTGPREEGGSESEELYVKYTCDISKSRRKMQKSGLDWNPCSVSPAPQP